MNLQPETLYKSTQYHPWIADPHNGRHKAAQPNGHSSPHQGAGVVTFISGLKFARSKHLRLRHRTAQGLRFLTESCQVLKLSQSRATEVTYHAASISHVSHYVDIAAKPCSLPRRIGSFEPPITNRRQPPHSVRSTGELGNLLRHRTGADVSGSHCAE